MNDDPTRKARLQAIIIEGRKRVAERRRRIEELTRTSSQDDSGAQDASGSEEHDGADGEFQNLFYDAAFEARIADIAAWLDEEPEYRIVTIDELMEIGAPEGEDTGKRER